MSVNKVIILGRLGKDPETKTTNAGTVTSFSIATEEKWTDKTSGEKKSLTDWHNCVAWRGTGDIAAKYLHKGDYVYVEGKMRTRSWEKDGITRYATDVIVDVINLIPNGKTQQQAQVSDVPSWTRPQEPVRPTDAAPSFTDDLPF